MTTTDAQIKIEINVTCPHCDEYINILDENKFPISPQYSFISELGLLPIKSIILPCIMLAIYAGIIALWIKEVMKKR